MKKKKKKFSNYLGYINIGTFGSGNHHHFEIVEFGQRSFGRGTSLVTSVIQNTIDVIFKSLPEGVTYF